MPERENGERDRSLAVESTVAVESRVRWGMRNVSVRTRLAGGVALAAGALLLAMPVAAEAAPAGSDSGTPLVAADSGVRAETLDLVEQSPPPGGVSPTAVEKAAAVGASVCTGGIDYPHISAQSPQPYTINTHLDQNCRAVPSQSSIEGSLYRSRWYGWEHLVSGQDTRPGEVKWSLFLNKSCTPGDWYQYRANGRFYTLVGTTRWSVDFYNENPSEIKCVSRPGAPD
jgi:hypothetical protein